MKWFRSPAGIAVMALALLVAVGTAGFVLTRDARADGQWWGEHRFAGRGFDLPPELEELMDLPAEERLGHFRGARFEMTDRDGNPLTVQVTAGAVTAVDATSLTLAANDGSSRTFGLDDATSVHGKSGGGSQPTERGIAPDDAVVVVTVNEGTTARAVLVGADSVFGGRGGHWGRFGWRR